MSYTEHEFNIAMAELDGYEVQISEDDGTLYMSGKDAWYAEFHNYYNDLNYLIPLAFKEDFVSNRLLYEEGEYEQWLSLLRDGLFELAQERKG